MEMKKCEKCGQENAVSRATCFKCKEPFYKAGEVKKEKPAKVETTAKNPFEDQKKEEKPEKVKRQRKPTLELEVVAQEKMPAEEKPKRKPRKHKLEHGLHYVKDGDGLVAICKCGWTKFYAGTTTALELASSVKHHR